MVAIETYVVYTIGRTVCLDVFWMAETKWWEKYQTVDNETLNSIRERFAVIHECECNGKPYVSDCVFRETTPEHDKFMHKGGAYFLSELFELMEEKRRKYCGSSKVQSDDEVHDD